jgi:hypothetical protein
MGRLLGYVMAMQRKHGGWEEVVWEIQQELRWSESDRGVGDVMDIGERRSGDRYWQEGCGAATCQLGIGSGVAKCGLKLPAFAPDVCLWLTCSASTNCGSFPIPLYLF